MEYIQLSLFFLFSFFSLTLKGENATGMTIFTLLGD